MRKNRKNKQALKQRRVVKWVLKGFTLFQESEVEKLKFSLKRRTQRPHKRGRTYVLKFVDAVRYFCFCSQSVASICVNKKQRKLMLQEKYVEGEQSQAGFGYTAKKLNGIRASAQSCPCFPPWMKKKNKCPTNWGKENEF